jgi:hypothetical protein
MCVVCFQDNGTTVSGLGPNATPGRARSKESSRKETSTRKISMKRFLLSLFTSCAVFGSFAISAQTLKPTRVVQGNALTSERDPGVRIELPKNVQYVGADRWVLYDVADAEMHIFVEADDRKQVKRMYWIQFEGYLPSLPKLTYTPQAGQGTMQIAGMDFYTRARFGLSSETPKAGSEMERVNKMLSASGFTLPAEMINARFIHYLDEPKRRELMIIVSEDMAPWGYTHDALIKGTPTTEPWVSISRTMIESARKHFTIQTQSRP